MSLHCSNDWVSSMNWDFTISPLLPWPFLAVILAAGLALQKRGVIPEGVDVKAAVGALIDPSFTARLASVRQ